MNDTVTTLSAAAAASVVPPTPVDAQLSTLNPQPTSPLFAQAKGESDRAFEAFRVYLELGSKRRFAAVGGKVGASYRTVQRWARDFDWCGRIKTCAAHSAEQFVQTENAVHREDFLDAAARAKAFRDRQYDLAEAMLDAAERYLERVDENDVDLMSFGDACKALEVASRIGQQAASSVASDSAASAQNALRDQLATLLDQVYADTPVPSPLNSPRPADGSGIKGEGQPSTTAPAQV